MLLVYRNPCLETCAQGSHFGRLLQELTPSQKCHISSCICHPCQDAKEKKILHFSIRPACCQGSSFHASVSQVKGGSRMRFRVDSKLLSGPRHLLLYLPELQVSATLQVLGRFPGHEVGGLEAGGNYNSQDPSRGGRKAGGVQSGVGS